MRSLSVQVQPNRSPGVDMQRISAAFTGIATANALVSRHAFDNGHDRGPYYNYTFGTDRPKELWQQIRTAMYESDDLGPHMQRASMAMCSSEAGWDDYALLYHFDPAVKLDDVAAL